VRVSEATTHRALTHSTRTHARTHAHTHTSRTFFAIPSKLDLGDHRHEQISLFRRSTWLPPSHAILFPALVCCSLAVASQMQ
jgi:hypothetical protein